MRNGIKINRLVIVASILVLIVISIVIVRNYVVEIAVISGASMEPLIRQGDHILINRLAYRSSKPVKGDIIAIKTGWLMMVKRVLGVPGDIVELKGNTLSCNGEIIQLGNMNIHHKGKPRQFGPSVVSDRHIFVIGDNAEYSIDSRTYGMVKYEEIVGKVAVIYFPPGRIRGM